LEAEAERVEKEAAGELGSEMTDENGTPLPSTDKMKQMLGKAIVDMNHPADNSDALDDSIKESLRLLNTYKDLTAHIHKQLDAYAEDSSDLDNSVEQSSDPQVYSDKAKTIDAEVAGIMGEPIPEDTFKLDSLPPMPDMGEDAEVTMVTRSDYPSKPAATEAPAETEPESDSDDSHAGEFTVHVNYENPKVGSTPAATDSKVEADAVDQLSSDASIMNTSQDSSSVSSSTVETPSASSSSSTTAVTPSIDASVTSSSASVTTTTTTTKTHRPIIAPRELLHV